MSLMDHGGGKRRDSAIRGIHPPKPQGFHKRATDGTFAIHHLAEISALQTMTSCQKHLNFLLAQMLL